MTEIEKKAYDQGFKDGQNQLIESIFKSFDNVKEKLKDNRDFTYQKKLTIGTDRTVSD